VLLRQCHTNVVTFTFSHLQIRKQNRSNKAGHQLKTCLMWSGNNDLNGRCLVWFGNNDANTRYVSCGLATLTVMEDVSCGLATMTIKKTSGLRFQYFALR